MRLPPCVKHHLIPVQQFRAQHQFLFVPEIRQFWSVACTSLSSVAPDVCLARRMLKSLRSDERRHQGSRRISKPTSGKKGRNMNVVHAGFKSVFSQSTGVVFAGRNGLDFLELRLGTVRIPEVSLRLREAQRILDGLDVERVDLLGSIVSDDESFFRNIKIKSLLAAIVQVGLYDRLLKSQRSPDVLVGAVNGDSALLVCAGQITFETLILQSPAIQTLKPRLEVVSQLNGSGAQASEQNSSGSLSLPFGQSLNLPIPGMQVPLAPLPAPASSFDSQNQSDTGLPSLTGLSLTEYRAFMKSEDGGMVELGQPVMDLKKLVSEIVEHQAITRYINLGPGTAIPVGEYEQIAELTGADEVTVIDSIDLDPMLNWFWKQMRPVAGIAQ